jgi:putative transcriptional regulator
VDRLRIFHGYAGWGAKQLDVEITASTWLTSPLSLKLLFDTPQELIWENAIHNLGFDPNHLVSSRSAFLN